MSCNCKSGKTQKLNNLDSQDHLNVVFDTYKEILQDREEGKPYDELEARQLIAAFFSAYPNASGTVTADHAASTIKNIYNQYYGRKR